MRIGTVHKPPIRQQMKPPDYVYMCLFILNCVQEAFILLILHGAAAPTDVVICCFALYMYEIDEILQQRTFGVYIGIIISPLFSRCKENSTYVNKQKYSDRLKNIKFKTL